MKNLIGALCVVLCLLAVAVSAPAQKAVATNAAKEKTEVEDPYLWLEEVLGGPALTWVRACNAASSLELASGKDFQQLKEELRKIMDSNARIPFVSKRGEYYYNFWRDAKHPRGIWRRSTPEEYRKADPEWEVILDVDALNKAENMNWVWKGADILKAGGYRHMLVNLSRGGADATEVREFDIETKAFVEDGFRLPEAKGGMSWIDKDSVYVATDFGPDTLTTSGYPRIVKLWKRGTPLAEAEIVFQGEKTDMSVGAYYDDTKGYERHFVYQTPAFYKNRVFLRQDDGKLVRIEVPEDANAGVHRQWLMVTLRSAWQTGGSTYPSGSLITIKFSDFMQGKRNFSLLYEPAENNSLSGTSWTKNHLILNIMEDVKSKLVVLTPTDGKWKQAVFTGAPENVEARAWGIDSDESDDYFMTVTGFLTPSSLYWGTIGETPVQIKSTPAFFDASDMEVSQHFTVSQDGTRIPYFQVNRKDLKADGKNPTLLYGYGGFEIPMTPGYGATTGRAWLEPGGVYVLANIRGGGEYGPRWHQAALKEKRHKAFEDFAAVAKDLFKRGITSPDHLGAMGGSNGGLLVGNMITLYPELFKAIVCQVPLLDMKRYNKLLAGASWMAEYGNPDKPEEWAFLKNYSPYHNLKEGVKYPGTLFTTSTRDDRVHPGHARKMMARMQAMGQDVRYYENTEGGHGGAADNSQRAYMWAISYNFLWRQLR
ncbi:MAG TPA: S9 family peptidase [Candidatus Aminicenantes bacterium]|nr:S9 family peptidase [Candidatus Aminicenantes bacterium]